MPPQQERKQKAHRPSGRSRRYDLPGILADVFEHLAAFDPFRRRPLRNGPFARPRLRVHAGIVNRVLVGERPQVGTRDTFDHVELFGRRVPAGDPLLFVETDGVDGERVAVPSSDRVAEVRRPETCGMLAAVHVNDAPRMRTGDVEDIHLLLFGYFHYLEARSSEEPVARGRLAPHEGWVEIVFGVSELLQRTRPRLRGDLVASRHPAEAWPYFPVAFVLFRRSEVHVSVGPARCRLSWRRRGLSSDGQRRAQQEHAGKRELLHRMTSFCPDDSTIIVVGIEPAALLPSLASAAPSTIALSPIFSVSFFHPPRTSA